MPMLRDMENQLLGLGDRVKHDKTGQEGTFIEAVLRGGNRRCLIEGDSGEKWEAPTWLLLRTGASPSTARAERLRSIKRIHNNGNKTAVRKPRG